MAIVGEQLLQPESGMQRIDNSNINIKYLGTWKETNVPQYYNSTLKYSEDITSKYEFYFYGTKFNIIANDCNLYSKNVTIKIDNEIKTGYTFVNNFPVLESNLVNYCQRVLFSIDNLTENIHKVEVSGESLGSTYSLGLDCIDIDEDGYMVYCDDNGKLYYDVTPIMTSNNTPSPYVASASSENTSNSLYVWKLFDGTPYSYWGNLTSDMTNAWVKLDMGSATRINSFSLTNRSAVNNNDTLVTPKKIELLGSNNNVDYKSSLEVKNQTNWTQNETRIYNTNTIYEYRYYKLNLYENNGATTFGFGDLRFLLAVETPFYLIQDNITNKIYNYDEENNQLMEVTDTSILKEDALNNACIYDLSKVIPLLDTLSDDLTILCNNNKKIIAKGIKSNKELIIGKNSFSTKIAKNIDFFQLDENATAKIIFSIDDGVTWKTYNSSTNTFEDLGISIPVDKDYSDFTEEEKIAWEEAKEIAYNQGIDSSILTTINFNEFDSEKMKFGYVLTATDTETMDKMTNLIWHFDSKGVMELVDGDKVKQQLFYGGVKLISNIDADMLKVNITYEGIN